MAARQGRELQVVYDERDEESASSVSSEQIAKDKDSFDEDAYGAAIVAVVRDIYFVHRGYCQQAGHEKHRGARVIQLISSLVLQFITVGLKLYLIMELSRLVTSSQVHEARVVYDRFEVAMYDPGSLRLTSNNHHRGTGGIDGPHFHKENFINMDGDDKMMICAMPLSQLNFFRVILLIWTLTVMQQAKKMLRYNFTLVCEVPTVSSPQEMLEFEDDEEKDPSGEATLVGLVWYVKLLVLVMTILRTAMNVFLLWKGARWLLATLSFSDLLLNAIALEFILLLSELLYNVVISNYHKVEVQRTFLYQQDNRLRVSCQGFMWTWFYLVLSFGFAYIYPVYFQQVFPDYQWDIHEPCESYLVNISAV